MKKLLIALGLGALMMGTAVMADNTKKVVPKEPIIKPILPIAENTNNAAFIIVKKDEDSCQYDFFGLILESDDRHFVETSSGNVKGVCHLTFPEGDEPEEVYKDKGFECRMLLDDGTVISTDKTSFIATPGGEATFICDFKGVNITEE